MTTPGRALPEQCELTLHLASDGRQIDEAKVEPAFRQAFVVSPLPTEYFLELHCAGFQRFRSDPFEVESSTGPPLDLGGIQLAPTADFSEERSGD